MDNFDFGEAIDDERRGDPPNGTERLPLCEATRKKLCPRCKCCEVETEWVDCYAACDDGAIDLYEDDAINESPGTFANCTECNGEGGAFVERCIGNCDDNGKHARRA